MESLVWPWRILAGVRKQKHASGGFLLYNSADLHGKRSPVSEQQVSESMRSYLKSRTPPAILAASSGHRPNDNTLAQRLKVFKKDLKELIARA